MRGAFGGKAAILTWRNVCIRHRTRVRRLARMRRPHHSMIKLKGAILPAKACRDVIDRKIGDMVSGAPSRPDHRRD